MEEVTLLLFFREAAYGRRFLRFLSGKKNPRIHPELVTKKEMLLLRVGTPSRRLVVVTDDETVCEDGKREVVLLAGEQNRRQKKIFQFQCAEGIYEQLLALLGIEKGQMKKAEEEKQEVIMLFSPEGIPLTELAVLMSQYLARQGRCLYVSLSGFPVYYAGEFQKEPDFQVPGLGEMMLCPAQEIFAGKLQQLVKTFGRADMLAPFSHFKDLLDCTKEDWRLFLKRLREVGGYEFVVVETGQLFENLMDLLEMGDRILIVYREDDFGKVRTDVFRHYCRMEKRDWLLEQATYVQMPEKIEEWRKNQGWQSLSEWADNSQLMGGIKDLLQNRKEEEDVCLWEDFG